MAKLISASIDVMKIDKTKLIPGKNGQRYCNITIALNDEPDQYQHDTAISLNQTKEERERGDKKVYIGNGKTVWSNEARTEAAQAETANPIEPGDDLPF